MVEDPVDGARPDGFSVRFSHATILALLTTGVVLCAAVLIARNIDGEQPTGTGTWVTGGATLLTLYYWRYRIVTFNLPGREAKRILFAILLTVLLPYIYVYSGFIEDDFRRPISKWVGDPLWLYVVPTTFFFLFDLQRANSTKTIALHCVEVMILFPLWTYCWFFLQALLGWWTM